MNTLILGCNGQLGRELVDAAPSNAVCIGRDMPELDITDATSVLDTCREVRPGLIINAAAYTAVDKAETEANAANAVNVDGAKNIAKAARDVGARLVQISTDFVFDGDASAPYQPDADPRPLSVYGRTKWEGEQAVVETHPRSSVVLRTAWLYGKYGNNFVNTMLRLMAERDQLGVVVDQIGAPTWANSLARAVWAIGDKSKLSGIFHWTDAGKCSWYDFAVAIQEEALELGLLRRKIDVKPITTADYPTPAARPRYSVLDCNATVEALNLVQEHWRSNLRHMLEGMTE